MATQMTRRQLKVLLGKVKKCKEKWARAVGHRTYLEECKSKNIVPRALNVARHMKSGELKTEEIFEIFKESSQKLLQNQLTKWENRIGNLTHQLSVYREKLKESLSQEDFDSEMEKSRLHATNVMNVVLLKKRTKICRDTNEQNITKEQYTVRVTKRKCRRFY